MNKIVIAVSILSIISSVHDTQAKRFFTLNERAFSNGCIRLSEPAKLATLLMEGDGHSSSTIKKTLKASKTKQVGLRSPIPTHLTYITTWIDENGTLQRRPDIYSHDLALRVALQTSDTLLAVISSEIPSDTSMNSSSPEPITIASIHHGP